MREKGKKKERKKERKEEKKRKRANHGPWYSEKAKQEGRNNNNKK